MVGKAFHLREFLKMTPEHPEGQGPATYLVLCVCQQSKAIVSSDRLKAQAEKKNNRGLGRV